MSTKSEMFTKYVLWARYNIGGVEAVWFQSLSWHPSATWPSKTCPHPCLHQHPLGPKRSWRPALPAMTKSSRASPWVPGETSHSNFASRMNVRQESSRSCWHLGLGDGVQRAGFQRINTSRANTRCPSSFQSFSCAQSYPRAFLETWANGYSPLL